MRSLSHATLAIVITLGLATQLGGCSKPLGETLYDNSIKIERSLYGLEPKTFTTTDNITFHYYEAGKSDAPTLVLVHGFSADKDNWLRFARHFSDNYHVIIPDLPGHGETGYDPKLAYDIPSQVARLHNFLDQLNLHNMHMAGSSMGGAITATYALTYPKDILSIALFDAAGVTSPAVSDFGKLIAENRNPFFMDNEDQIDNFLGFAMADPPYMPGPVKHAVARKYIQHKPELKKIFADIYNKNLIDDQLGNIHAPTLVLWGKQDRLLDVSMADVYAHGIQGAEKVVLDGVGHLPMLERPGESANIYLDFLSRHQ